MRVLEEVLRKHTIKATKRRKQHFCKEKSIGNFIGHNPDI
jgi:hypothetical protein